MQSLRLLVNLSTNEEMVPHLLAAKVFPIRNFERAHFFGVTKSVHVSVFSQSRLELPLSRSNYRHQANVLGYLGCLIWMKNKPSIFIFQAPEYVWNMLDETQAEDQLLRVVTLLANLVCTAHKQNLDPTLDLPLDDKTAEPDSM